MLWRSGLRVAQIPEDRSGTTPPTGCGHVLLSATAAVGAAIVGVGCLIADHSIAWSESSGLGWFLGDADD